MFSEIINRNSKEIKYICIADSTYVLLLYCLSKSLTDIQSTLFVVGCKFPKSILNRLPNYIILEIGQTSNHIRIIYEILRERKQLSKKYPFILKLPLYGIDHVLKSYVLLNYKKMVVIEDGYGLYNPPKSTNNILHKFIAWVFGIPNKTFGRGGHCSSIIYTGLLPYQNKGKQLIKISVSKELERDIDRHNFIFKVYDITPEDLLIFKNKKIILITQPFEELGIYTEKEKVSIYRKCIDIYDSREVIIKTHPRDNTNYSILFPNISVYTKPIPLEILSILGIKFEIAYTYSSTAIYSLPNNTKKIILKEKQEEII